MIGMKQKLYIFLISLASFAAAVVLALSGTELYFALGRVSLPDAVRADTVRYIAHRGLSSVYYENTAEAFLAAGESAFFYGIETDVWKTADGVWVCAHDNTPFKDASKRISDISYAEAVSLPLKDVKGVTPSGEDARLCDFSAYLRICRDAGKVPLIEIKFAADKDDLQKLVEVTQTVLPLDGVQFISFHKRVIDGLLDINGNLTVQLLVTRAWDAYRYARMGYNMGVYKGAVSKRLVKTIHSNRSYLGAWTVNDPAEAVRLAAMEVDFITTDCILFP